jgi:hypothetical protein
VRYEAYGVVVESEVELPELRRFEDPAARAVRTPDWIVALVDGLPELSRWATEIGRPEPWLFVNAAGDQAVLRFLAGGAYVIDRGRRTIGVLRTEYPGDTVSRHLLINQVLSRAITGTGTIVLHASAVDLAGRGVVLCGDSGAGKSTTAARLGRRGAVVIADDVSVVRPRGQGWELRGGEAAVWLSNAMAKAMQPGRPPSREWSKVRVADGLRFQPATALAIIVVLHRGEGAAVEVSSLRGAEAFAAVARSAYSSPFGPPLAEGESERLLALLGQVPVTAAYFPDEPSDDDMDLLYERLFEMGGPRSVAPGP